VKVGAYNGAFDVSQVIAAIGWVIGHRNDNGLNIRVLNLSLGTDSSQDYQSDPLSLAAELAWRAGIVVVTAAGNNGSDGGRLLDPAWDPYLIAVGADDTMGTAGIQDDSIPSFSNRGDGIRNPDLVAPGVHVQGLRVPGSYVDQQYPGGRLGDRFFRGSGTSQAAAMVSGAAALILQARPYLTPDQVKGVLTGSAIALPQADPRGQGHGLLDVKDALRTAAPLTVQSFAPALGTGTLEGSRGSYHVSLGGRKLSGETDIFGNQASVRSLLAGGGWAGSTWTGSTWSGGTWSGGTWSGSTWSGDAWYGSTWSGGTWSGSTWSGSTWSGSTWTGSTWSGSTWSSGTWSSGTWSGCTWTGSTWSVGTWS
jgi:serine protease AprX